jgi:hypothetical protein
MIKENKALDSVEVGLKKCRLKRKKGRKKEEKKRKKNLTSLEPATSRTSISCSTTVPHSQLKSCKTKTI